MKRRRTKAYYKRLSFILLIELLAMFIFVIGMTMNFTVMMHNNGKMPVYSSLNYSDARHFSYQNKSQVDYWILSDIVYMPFSSAIASIGDLFMYVSAIVYLEFCFILIIQNIFRKKHKPYK